MPLVLLTGGRRANMTRAHRYFPALLLVAGVAVAAPACAAQTYGYGYPTRGVYGRDIERRAYDYGYREGLEQGNNDARRNRDFSPERHSEFRDADDGYQPRSTATARSTGRITVRDSRSATVKATTVCARSRRLRQPGRRRTAVRIVTPRGRRRRLCGAGRLPRRIRRRAQRRARPQPLRPGPVQALP